MINSLLKNLAASFPSSPHDGLSECRFLVGIAGAAVLLLAVYLGPFSGQF